MKTFLITHNHSLYQHVRVATGIAGKIDLMKPEEVDFSSLHAKQNLIIIHSQSFASGMEKLLSQATASENIVGVASDRPSIIEMLSFARMGIRAYFNGYMAEAHYQQMLRLLDIGLNWFPPQLLSKALAIAGKQVDQGQVHNQLALLTRRERDIADAVSLGMSNKKIADTLHISERTVKTHLTHIFGKIGVKDRVSLVIKLTKPAGEMVNQA